MCGICGIIHSHSERFVDKDALLGMRDIMFHRGPDEGGFHLRNNVGLGHRRLSIIDLSTGQQPMANEDGTVWIVYNGELYNYLDLRGELIGKGHVFRTRSDTEVIVHAYEEYGERCLEHMRGMFAFAIYDHNRGTLFAAKDRIGIKPLYYTVQDGTLYFASEIKSLLTIPEVGRELDADALYRYLRVRYVPGPRTMFRNIRKLLPGQFLSYAGGELRTRRYWDLADTPSMDPGLGYADIEERFEALLEESIRIRLMSEVPLGAFLSGGIDSSVVVARMSAMSDDPIKTFSVGYRKDYGENEFKFAKLVADRYETEHYEYRISSQNFFDFLPDFVWHLDEPVADSACIPLYFLSKYAKQYVTVVLSGEGADEVLSGYGIYRKMLAIESFRKLPRVVREDVLGNLMSMFFRRGKLRRYLDQSRLPLETRYKGVSTSFGADEIGGLYGRKGENDLEAFFRSFMDRTEGRPPLARMMYTDMNTWLPDDLLVKADKMTMAASQELRVPFLDHKMVEFGYSLPQDCRIRKSESKYVLRQIAKSLLPKAIMDRPKKGFSVPISQWFRDDLNEISTQVLCDPTSACAGYFDTDTIRRIIKAHGTRGIDNSDMIWTLLVFEFWHKEMFVPSHPRRSPHHA